MTTKIIGTYVAPSATNLTQSVTRSASLTSALTPIALTTQSNYSKTYSATFTISSAVPATVSLSCSSLNGLTFNRVSNTYTLSGNNWAYFKKALRNISVVTDNSTWPNPAFTIASAITDGTTNLSGTVSVSSLVENNPTTPGTPTLVRNWNANVTVTWASSTQTFGSGMGGYYVYRNGDTVTPIATVTHPTTFYVDTSVSNSTAYYYQVKAFSVGGAQSTISSVSLTTPAATAPTNPVLSMTRTSLQVAALSWTASTQTVGPGLAGYKVYKNGVEVTSTTGLFYSAAAPSGETSTFTVKAYDLTTVPLLSGVNNSQIVQPLLVSLDYSAPNFGYRYTLNGTGWASGSHTPGITTRAYKPGVGSNVALGLGYDGSGTHSMYKSVDGMAWMVAAGTLPTEGGSSWWGTPVYGNSTWVSIYRYGTGSTAMYSTDDGATWASVALPFNQAWQLLFGNGVFIAMPNSNSGGLTHDTCLKSTDGITWTTHALPAISGGWYATYAGGKFVATANSSTAAYSVDGATWASMTLPFTLGVGGFDLIDGTDGTTGAARYNGSEWRMTNLGTSSNLCAKSTDGVTWTSDTLPSSGLWMAPIAAPSGRWVTAIHNTTSSAYVDNAGSSWTSSTLPGSKPYIVSAYFAGKYVLGNGSGTPVNDTVLYSSDGVSWSTGGTVYRADYLVQI